MGESSQTANETEFDEEGEGKEHSSSNSQIVGWVQEDQDYEAFQNTQAATPYSLVTQIASVTAKDQLQANFRGTIPQIPQNSDEFTPLGFLVDIGKSMQARISELQQDCITNYDVGFLVLY